MLLTLSHPSKAHWGSVADALQHLLRSLEVGKGGLSFSSDDARRYAVFASTQSPSSRQGTCIRAFSSSCFFDWGRIGLSPDAGSLTCSTSIRTATVVPLRVAQAMTHCYRIMRLMAALFIAVCQRFVNV